MGAFEAASQPADEILDVGVNLSLLLFFLNRPALVANVEASFLQNRNGLMRVGWIIGRYSRRLQDEGPRRQLPSVNYHAPLRHVTAPAKILCRCSYVLLSK